MDSSSLVGFLFLSLRDSASFSLMEVRVVIRACINRSISHQLSCQPCCPHRSYLAFTLELRGRMIVRLPQRRLGRGRQS